MPTMESKGEPAVRLRRKTYATQQIKEFPEWTSTHGVPQIGRSSKCYCFSFWTIITLIAFGLLVWQVVLIFVEFYKYDVSVQIELEFKQRTFPAVTVCDLNPYKRSIAMKEADMQTLMDTYLYAMRQMACSTYTNCDMETNSTLAKKMDTLGFSSLNDTMALQTRAKMLLDLVAAQYNLSEAKAQYADFMQGCSFNTEDCEKSDWTLFEDNNMGNCFTFNQDSTRNATRAGPIYGLRVIFKTNVSEYLLTSDTAGMKVLIHDQNEYPFPDIFGYNVQVGTATSIGVTFTEISRLGPPYGECTDDKPSGYLYPLQYSTEGCQRSKYQTAVVDACGCYDPSYMKPNGTDTVCSLTTDFQCWSSQSNSTSSDNTCTQPCHEGTYEVTVSAAKWPSASLTSIGECTEGEYGNTTCLDMYSNNGALVEVYYEKLNYETMDESAAYTVSSLLSDIGGQIGLWLGMSVISLIEVLVLFFQVFASCISPRAGEVVGF